MFAAALVIALGAILSRTIPAIAIGIVAFLAVRVAIESLVRPRLRRRSKLGEGMNLDTAWVVDGRMYHPSSRFWEFQASRRASISSLTLALLALVAWWIDHRVN